MVESPLCIVMEFCDGGSLSDFLTKTKNLNPNFLCKATKGIASGINRFMYPLSPGILHLHSEGIIHRDIGVCLHDYLCTNFIPSC